MRNMSTFAIAGACPAWADALHHRTGNAYTIWMVVRKSSGIHKHN